MAGLSDHDGRNAHWCRLMIHIPRVEVGTAVHEVPRDFDRRCAVERRSPVAAGTNTSLATLLAEYAPAVPAFTCSVCTSVRRSVARANSAVPMNAMCVFGAVSQIMERRRIC